MGSGGTGGPRPPFKSLTPCDPPKFSVKWLHHAVFVLVTSLCLAFSDADIGFDFVLIFLVHTVNTRAAFSTNWKLIQYVGLRR